MKHGWRVFIFKPNHGIVHESDDHGQRHGGTCHACKGRSRVAISLRGCEVVWLGTATGREKAWIQDEPWKFFGLPIPGVRSLRLERAFAFLTSSAENLRRSFSGFAQRAAAGGGRFWWRSFGSWRPCCFSVPDPLSVARTKRSPRLNHRVLAPFAKRVLTGFPEVYRRGEFVGNPVREALLSHPRRRFVTKLERGL